MRSKIIVSFLFSLMLAANCLSIFGTDTNVHELGAFEAGLLQNSLDGTTRFKAHWEDSTKKKFLGCYDKGSDCIVVAVLGIGVSFSEAGIHLQELNHSNTE